MKVLLIVPMAPQAEGAGAIPELLHAQLTGLLERHEVTLLGTFGDHPGQAEAAAGLREAGIDVHFVDRRPSSSASRRWSVRLDLATRWAVGRRPWRAVSATAGVQPLLDRLTRERDFDVVAVEESTMSTLRLPADTPTVLTEHEATKAPARGSQALDGRRWERFQRRAWERFDLVQVYGEGDAAAIREREPALAPRLRVNPFGLVLPEPADPALEVAGTLLFVGTFTHAPNRDAALWLGREIMPAILPRQPRAKLRIVGTVPPPEVFALAGPNVEVVANAPSVRPHIEAASVVLAPVRSGGGMRMKVLQALAAGKPVVTTERGVEGFDVLDPAPPLVRAESGEEIAAAVTALLDDDAGRAQLGRRAREFAERWHSPGAWAARLTDVYEEARAER
jgi:polysaccharide biosynthesis protein PslH